MDDKRNDLVLRHFYSRSKQVTAHKQLPVKPMPKSHFDGEQGFGSQMEPYKRFVHVGVSPQPTRETYMSRRRLLEAVNDVA